MQTEADLSDLPSIANCVKIFNHKDGVGEQLRRRRVHAVDMRYVVGMMDRTITIKEASEMSNQVSLIGVKNFLRKEGSWWGTNNDFYIISHRKRVIVIFHNEIWRKLEEKLIKPLREPLKKFLRDESVMKRRTALK